MEEKVIRRLYHKHPLTLTENVRIEDRVDCYGCGNPVTNLEMAYVCMEHHCSSRNRRIILHKKCGELPDQIRHPKHPNHPIHLFDFHQSKWHMCHVCRRDLDNVLGYRCSSCEFDVDITCEKIGIDALLEERKELEHPSHVEHSLTLMRKPAFAFYCDGCGAQDVDMAYICSTCEFWVHKSCAALPLRRHCHHHHHLLSLAFSFPKEHLKYNYKCEVCDKLLDRTCWVYFCGDCRYFVHIKCVGSTNPDSNSNEDDEGLVEFPLYANDMSDKLITPFVMREKGLDNIPNTTSSLFLSNYHDHPLSLVSEEENNDEEELKICDVCVTPISSPPYYHCPTSACTYFIHSICSLLPNTLHSSSPNLLQLYGDCQEIPNKNHSFTLYKSKDRDAISYWYCNLCDLPTNGMGYSCEECETKIDVKCASLPTTIKHLSHPHHKFLNRIPTQKEDGKRNKNKCHGCYTRSKIAYHCSNVGCAFALNLECGLLPMSITEHEWDEKHPLLLTFDASLDHPSDFFCEFCERQMHPKSWMYHCRKCDLSFHLVCLKNASGWYRNIKFGRRFEMDGIHPHPLTFAYITLKRHCDLCHQRVYTDSGFECMSCYYVVCHDCGGVELEKDLSFLINEY